MASPSSTPGDRCCSLEQILQLDVIAIPDFLAQVVEQFEHGERLLGRPGGGDFDGDRTEMGWQWPVCGLLMTWFHGAGGRAGRRVRGLP